MWECIITKIECVYKFLQKKMNTKIWPIVDLIYYIIKYPSST